MSVKYCLKCGTKNELDASFCKKCGASFNIQKEPSVPEPELSEEEQEEKLLRIKKRKRGNRAVSVASVPQEELGMVIDLPNDDGSSDDDEGEGVSLNYCPQVERLEIESIQVDSVKGVKFGDLVEAARREQAQRGSSAQP